MFTNYMFTNAFKETERIIDVLQNAFFSKVKHHYAMSKMTHSRYCSKSESTILFSEH